MACNAAGPGAIFEYGLSGQVQEETCSSRKCPERLKLHSNLCVICNRPASSHPRDSLYLSALPLFSALEIYLRAGFGSVWVRSCLGSVLSGVRGSRILRRIETKLQQAVNTPARTISPIILPRRKQVIQRSNKRATGGRISPSTSCQRQHCTMEGRHSAR